ncbi:hypothetical protein BOX15_Mlig013810g3 [Macrostomum lignano]|uniref:Uncharacterized protein n=2 Tax=Macrostomum lignano TaxID=282301 RepID=A0A267DKL4_9PLAT|nr:hypothetical protein BOX15_Mlig013810g3 [Macrostomum lignano]
MLVRAISQRLLLLLGLAISLTSGQLSPQPEQVHLSVTNDPTQMVVTWVTQSPTNGTSVDYGTNRFDRSASGIQEKFVDGGSAKRVIYIHRAVMSGLRPGQRYVYRVGSELGWSDVFLFTATKSGSDWPARFAVYGDMGNTNGKSIPFLQKEAQSGDFDMVLHVGDFAYNMDTNNALVGDEFMRQVEPIAAYVPYMTCPGNHESAYNFSNYRRRFSMPGGDGEGSFFSFDYGPVHVISFSSEFYYYLDYGWKQAVYQFQWLEEDLQRANQNRANRPWIIAMAHRPMYCSNSDDPQHCTNADNLIRTGFPVGSKQRSRIFGSDYILGVEQLFYRYGVDLIFGAHEHSYERMWPVYNQKVCNSTTSSDNPYDNPPAPVHVITGSAGCVEGEDPFIPAGLPWSAFRSDDYGYTRMTVANATHLMLEQVSVDKGGQVIDSIVYVRNKHGSSAFNCV